MAATKSIFARMPWFDRAGNFSILKTTTLVLVSLPAVWLLIRALFLGLGPRPLTEAIHFVGDWTIYLLLVTLAVTPARRLLDWNKLIQVRRIIGLSALFYILLHFSLYTIDSRLDPVFVAKEIVSRVYLTIGFTALLGLVALGVTSTDGMVKRMGGKNWARLHKLIYIIVPLGILHYYMQSKLIVSPAVYVSGVYFWLMGYRIMSSRLGIKQGLLPLVGLTIVATLLTVAVEALWYGLATRIDVNLVLSANLGTQNGIRPSWWVFATGLGVAVIAEIRQRFAPVRPQTRTARAT